MENPSNNKFYVRTVYRAMTGEEVQELLDRHGVTGDPATFILQTFKEASRDADYCPFPPDDQGRLCWGQTWEYTWELLAANMGYICREDMSDASEERVNEVFDLFFSE